MAANGVNKVILVGHLGRDPELRSTGAGRPVANFSLATTESWKGEDGERQDRTEWHRIVAWGKTAEVCAEHLVKGRQVYIEGRLQTREWDDKEGRKQRTTEVIAGDVVFLGRGEDKTAQPPMAPAPDYDYGPPPWTDEEVAGGE